jgi:hypothetical protein
MLLIEDVAQAWLSSRDGIPVGSHDDLSFHERLILFTRLVALFRRTR